MSHDLVARLASGGVSVLADGLYEANRRTDDRGRLALMGQVAERYRADNSAEVREVLLEACIAVGDMLEVCGDDLGAIGWFGLAGVVGEGAVERAARLRVANALLRAGIAQARFGMREDAVASFAEQVRRYGDDADPAVRNEVTIGMLRLANQLVYLGRDDDALLRFELVLDRLAGDTSLDATSMVVASLHGLARVFGRHDRIDDVSKVAEALVGMSRAGGRSVPFDLVRSALSEISEVLLQAGRTEVTIRLFDAIIAMAEERHNPVERGVAVLAFYDKASVLQQLDRPSEADRAISEMVSRFAHDGLIYLESLLADGSSLDDVHVAARRAGASYQKAFLLSELGRTQDALRTLNEVINQFGDDQRPEIVDLVERARMQRDDLDC